MKALSLRQPYAKLIIDGRKKIKIRNWNTNFRGKFLVHLAKKIFKNDCNNFGINPKQVDTGMIIGRVNLIDVKTYNSLEEFKENYNQHLAKDKWFRKKCYGFILKDPIRIRNKIPIRGSLNFFEVNIDE